MQELSGAELNRGIPNPVGGRRLIGRLSTGSGKEVWS